MLTSRPKPPVNIVSHLQSPIPRSFRNAHPPSEAPTHPLYVMEKKISKLYAMQKKISKLYAMEKKISKIYAKVFQK
jgi:hypothetical protein